MALVHKTRFQRNLGERPIGFDQAASRVIETERPLVFAECDSEVRLECLRNVDIVTADRGGK